MAATHGQLAQERGRWAEDRVARHLQLRGWRLCARNWLGGGGELDLVASRWKTLRVVEVRYRQAGHLAARESVDQEKRARTLRAAKALVHSHDLHCYRLRIELATVDAHGRIHWTGDLREDA